MCCVMNSRVGYGNPVPIWHRYLCNRYVLEPNQNAESLGTGTFLKVSIWHRIEKNKTIPNPNEQGGLWIPCTRIVWACEVFYMPSVLILKTILCIMEAWGSQNGRIVFLLPLSDGTWIFFLRGMLYLSGLWTVCVCFSPHVLPVSQFPHVWLVIWFTFVYWL